jgi:NitT/TauT family transport system substrate-binding protein
MSYRFAGAVLIAALAFPAWSQAPETPKLRVSTIPIAGMTPLFAANKLGYFKNEGLEVQIDFAAGGAQSLPLVMQGTLQLSNGPIVSVALAHQQGFDLRLIGPTLDDKRSAPGQTASVVKADGPIKTVADLRGKRIGVNTINSVNWMYDRAFLRKHGLDPSQVTYVEIPFPSMIDALARGSVEAVNVPQPFHRIAVDSGKGRVLGYPFVEVQPGVHIAAYGASAKWLEANPNTVRAFTRAMRHSIERLRANPKEAKDLIAEFTKAKRELVEQIPIDDWSTELSLDDVAKTLKVMQQEGLLKKPIEAKTIVYEVGR